MLHLTKAACLAILATVAVAEITAEEAQELENFWAYNHSDSNFPPPTAQGLGEWAEYFDKAKALVAQMTNEEKNNLTYGYTPVDSSCGGVSGSVERLGFPGMCLTDAGNGVRGTDFVNAYPAGLHVGAAWNKALANQRGFYMGKEFETKGVNVALGPVVGPVGRLAKGGRNWEGFSNDPYLTGALAAETVEGMQETVIACVKHFIGNEQETMRNPPMSYDSFNQSLSANIDDKTVHEVYLWPFQDTVRVGAGSVMASYNRVNNTYASQNAKTMNGLLKTELGFQGFVVSDWVAQHAGIVSAYGGLDMAMPDSSYWENGTLANAVANGTLAQDRLDDMATRIIATYYRYTNENATGQGMAPDLLEPHTIVNALDPAAKPTIFQGAVEGQVLVKNVDNTLPLTNPQLVSLFGYDAKAAEVGTPNDELSYLWTLGAANTLTYPNGSLVDPTAYMDQLIGDLDPTTPGPGVSLNGTLFCGGGSGSNSFAYLDSPLDAFTRQAYQDNFYLAYDVVNQNPDVQPESDACVVFINEFASEGLDRPYLADPYSDELVQNVASQCSNTIVVIHNAGVRLVDDWYNHENVTAIIYAHLPGQDSGRAITEVIFGNQSPSGRLPYTVAKNASDYGDLLDPIFPQEDAPYYPQDNFTEGVYIDYKHFIKNDIEPRFEFGYGLTYTEFEYSNLTVAISEADKAEYPPCTEIAEGGLPCLWDIVATVSVTVENTGNYTAAEVAQVYVGIPDGPEKVLRGFEKQSLAPGESSEFVFELTRRDFSTWDVVAQQWLLQEGDYKIYVGKSVLDIQLQDTVTF